jgi:integrase
VSIPVYAADQEKDGKVYPGFRFKRKVGKHTIKGQRASLKDLRELARTKLAAVTSGKISEQEDYKILSGLELVRYEAILALEKALGSSLISAVENELLPARRILAGFPGITIVFTSQDYAARHSGCRPMTVKWAAGRFLVTKRRENMSDRQFKRLHSRLRYFAARFGNYPISEIKELTLKSFLAGYGAQVAKAAALRRARKGKKAIPGKRVYEQRAYNNQREDIVGFMRWCEEQKLIPRDSLNYKAIIRHKLGPGARGTCSPSDLKKLIARCRDLRDEICVSLGAHAGIRSAEIERFKLCFVDWENHVISLPPFFQRVKVTKVVASRRIPIQPVLFKRLKKLLGSGFPPDVLVCRVKCWPDRLNRIKRKAGVKLPSNSLRHGFGSHRLQLTQDEAKTALEMGTSVAYLEDNYAVPQPVPVSKAWFRA